MGVKKCTLFERRLSAECTVNRIAQSPPGLIFFFFVHNSSSPSLLDFYTKTAIESLKMFLYHDRHSGGELLLSVRGAGRVSPSGLSDVERGYQRLSSL